MSSASSYLVGKRGNRRVEHVLLVQGDDAEAPAGAAEILAVGVDPQRISGKLAEQRAEPGHEGPVDIVSQQHEVWTFLEDAADRGNRFATERDSVRVARVDDEEGLHLRIEQRGEILVGELPALFLARLNEGHVQAVILQVRHLEIRREDGRHHGDGVAGVQEAVGLQRLEDVAHRGRAPFDRVEIERARWPGIAAHRPLQVLADDALVVHEHAIRHRIVVAENRVDELVHEVVRREAERRDGPRNDAAEERGAGHLGVRLQPAREACRDAGSFRHSAEAARQLHRALALGDGELAEQEECRARFGCDPVGVAASGVQVRDLRGFGGFRRDFREVVLDLERAERLVLSKRNGVHVGLLSSVRMQE